MSVICDWSDTHFAAAPPAWRGAVGAGWCECVFGCSRLVWDFGVLFMLCMAIRPSRVGHGCLSAACAGMR